MTWQIVFTKQAQKDARKIAATGLRAKAEDLLEIVRENPFRSPPPFHKLVGDLSGPIPAASLFNIDWSTKFWNRRKSSKSSACGPIMSEGGGRNAGATPDPIPDSDRQARLRR